MRRLAAEAVLDDRTRRAAAGAGWSGARCARRPGPACVLAGARSPERASSLPASWSWVTRTARRPELLGQRHADRSADRVEDHHVARRPAARRRRGAGRATSSTSAPSSTSWSGSPGCDRRCTARRRRPVRDVGGAEPHVDADAGRPRPPATRPAAPFGPATAGTPPSAVVALDDRDAVPAERGDARRSPARPVRRRRRPPTEAGGRAGYQSGSSVSRPDDGSPMHVTSGLRTSRTWHIWLQRVHGRIRSAWPARTLATRSGSAICARVISTPAHPPIDGPRSPGRRRRSSPGRTPAPSTGSAIDAARSMLKPGGWWKSGRVCSIEKIAPRTTTRESTPSHQLGGHPGACSGVIPAHGASSSHDSRSTTTRVGPTAERTAASTSRGEAQPISAPLVVTLVGQPGQELAHQAVLAGVDLDAVTPGVDGQRRPPRRTRSTTAAMSSASIHFGTSRVATSGTRDGAHSGALAVRRRALPAGVVERRPGRARPRRGTAAAIAAQPSAQRSASGARSYGQSDGWTLAPSTHDRAAPAARPALVVGGVAGA